jgi:nucleoid-associated protein YgaU
MPAVSGRPRTAPAENSSARTPADWGLPAEGKQSHRKLAVALCLLLGLFGAGGWFAYNRFLRTTSPGNDLAENDGTGADPESENDEGVDDSHEDVFADNGPASARHQHTGGRNVKRTNFSDTHEDDLSDNVEPDDSHSEAPRRRPSVQPGVRLSASGASKRAESLELDDGEELQNDDESEPRRMRHERDAAPISRNREAASRETAGGAELDDDETAPTLPPLGGASGSARRGADTADSADDRSDDDTLANPVPRVSTSNSDDEEAAPLRTAPRLTPSRPAPITTAPRLAAPPRPNAKSASKARTGAPDEEALGGYRVAEELSAGSDDEGKEIPSDLLDGYVPDDRSSQRAVSKTVIRRSADLPSSPDEEGAKGADDESARGNNLGNSGTDKFIRPTSADPRRGPVHAASYTVADGDTYWNISRTVYGTARYYAALARHNQARVGDPERLRPGMQIATPDARELEKRYPTLIEKPAPTSRLGSEPDPAAPRRSPAKVLTPGAVSSAAAQGSPEPGYFYSPKGEPMYRIGPGDTLSLIAQKHLGRGSRSEEIFEKNRDILKSPDNLTVGTVIRLPADASRLSLVPDAERRR